MQCGCVWVGVLFSSTCTCIIQFCKANGERQVASMQLWTFTNIISGHESPTRLHFRGVKVCAFLYISGPFPPFSRWSRACRDGACLDAAEINASSVGRCSLPAGGVAAGSVTTAACFTAPVPTAGRSNSLLLPATLSSLLYSLGLRSLTILNLSLIAHGHRRAPHSPG